MPASLSRPTLLSFVLCLSFAVSASEPSADAGNEHLLPVERVVLSTAGVGFFQHGGTLSGDGLVRLRFTTNQLNDLLKSLVVQDFGGGKVASVAYPGQSALDRVLAGFMVDLSAHPSIPELLAQLRGSEVNLLVDGGERLSGRVLGVETRPRAVAETVIESHQVNLLASDGVRTVALDTIRSFELLDPALQTDLERALHALADRRNLDRKPVEIRFSGTGARRVALGYVVEAPIWKTSYRLVLPQGDSTDQAMLQGWAIVENTTDHDWRSVELALISGRPLSFIEDLYQAIHIQRPEHRPERFEGIGPQVYGADAMVSAEASVPEEKLGTGRRAIAAFAAAPPPMPAPAPAPSAAPLSDLQVSLPGSAETRSLGSVFEYVLDGVNLDRQQSAMLPIVAEQIEAERISIFDASVLANHPLRGARLRNNSDKPLPDGPLTVLEGNSYAGDARIPHLPPGGERLLSFAVDLAISVHSERSDVRSTLSSARIEGGLLRMQQTRQRDTDYVLTSEADQSRQLVVLHPVSSGWTLTTPTGELARTETHYRLELAVPAQQTERLRVREERVDWEVQRLANLDESSLLMWSNNGKLSESMRAALLKAAQLRRELAVAERAVAEAERAMTEITREQERIRANLQALERGSSLHNRLVDKLNTQENELERLNNGAIQAREALERARAALETYLAELKIG